MSSLLTYSIFPRFACYNLRFIGISDERILNRKLMNVQEVCSRNVLVGLSELHASFGVCQSQFFDHVPQVIPALIEDLK